jgi:hypothetical protein
MFRKGKPGAQALGKSCINLQAPEVRYMSHKFPAAIFLTLSLASPALTHTYPQKGAPVITHATGTFEVRMTPQPNEDKSSDSKPDDAAIGRMTMDKQFRGDLEATSKGQMLGAMTAVKGSAGYVAMERVTGTLHGRSGTFVLQHTGTMNRGALQLSVTVVPDSGTGQLTGLTGVMTIIVTDGKHSYDFAYTLSEAY